MVVSVMMYRSSTQIASRHGPLAQLILSLVRCTDDAVGGGQSVDGPTPPDEGHAGVLEPDDRPDSLLDDLLQGRVTVLMLSHRPNRVGDRLADKGVSHLRGPPRIEPDTATNAR